MKEFVGAKVEGWGSILVIEEGHEDDPKKPTKIIRLPDDNDMML
jgi:hypothetical protein